MGRRHQPSQRPRTNKRGGDGMANVYKGSQVYPLYLNTKIPKCCAVKCRMNPNSSCIEIRDELKIDVFTVSIEQLSEAEISDLVNVGITGPGFCGGCRRGQHGLKRCVSWRAVCKQSGGSLIATAAPATWCRARTCTARLSPSLRANACSAWYGPQGARGAAAAAAARGPCPR